MASTTRLQPPRSPRPSRDLHDPHVLAEQVRFRRALTLLVMTVPLPGSAQLIAGSRAVGRVALRIWLGLLAVGLLSWLIVPRSWLLGLAVRPWFLSLAEILSIAIAIGWLALLLDAWRLGYPPALTRRHRLIAVVTTLALCLLVGYPLLKASRMAAAQHDLVAGIFTTADAKPTDGRINILVLGGDAAEGRIGMRPDSINLISVDEESGQAAMFSLPRNLEKARFAAGTPAAKKFPDGFWGDGKESDYLLNAVWAYGEQNRKLFPGGSPGAEATKQAVAGTLGLDVHYYVLVNLVGFRDLVNALGGITIDVKEQVPLGQSGQTLSPGIQRLEGYEALWYARAREGSSDYARMARQRCVIDAIVRQADPATVLRNFERLTASAENLVETDLPREILPDLVNLALKSKARSMVSVQFVPPLIDPNDPDIELIRDTVRESIVAPRRPAEQSGDLKTSISTPDPTPAAVGDEEGISASVGPPDGQERAESLEAICG